MTDKERIDKRKLNQYVDIVLDECLSVKNDAGWHKGDLDPTIPPASPRIDLADMKMINEITYLREPHPKFAIAYASLSALTKECQDVLIVKNLKKHLNQDTGRAWEDRDRWQFLGITEAEYYYRLRVGYTRMDAEVKRYEQYESWKGKKHCDIAQTA